MIRALALLAALATPAAAESVVAAVSQDQVAITANFEGTEILVYGAVKRDAPEPSGPLGVIVTVEGPTSSVMVRRKSRSFGIWINTAAVDVDRAPSFYAVATSAPLGALLTHTEDLRRHISIPQMIRSVGAPADVGNPKDFSEALIRVRKAQEVYQLLEGAVQIDEGTLFRTRIALPANLVEGNYTVRFFLMRGGVSIDQRDAVIYVGLVGLERWLYQLAHAQPIVYGALSLVIAVAAGWAASMVFRGLRT